MDIYNTYTRNTHKYKVNMFRLYNGVETKTKDNKKYKTKQKNSKCKNIYILLTLLAWWYQQLGGLQRVLFWAPQLLFCGVFNCKRGPLGPMLCPCFLVYGGGRTENRCLEFVGLSHTGSRLCVPDQGVTGGHTGRQWPVCRSRWSWSRFWWIRLATPSSGTNANEKTGRAQFLFYFLKLYLFRLSQRRLCCLQVISLSDCPRRKTASEDGCLGGFYSIAAGVLSCWSVYDVFVVLKEVQVGRSWSACGSAGVAFGRQVESCVWLFLCTVTLTILHLFNISYICQRLACIGYFPLFFLRFVVVVVLYHWQWWWTKNQKQTAINKIIIFKNNN